MTTNRREFLERLGATAAFGAIPLALATDSGVLTGARSATPRTDQGPHEFLRPLPRTEGQATWDMSWTAKLTGKKHRACFDSVEPEDGNGVFRASMWEEQYQSALGAHRADIITVLILRHNATVLALTHEMWERYGIGAAKGVKDPMTREDATRNPVLLTTNDGLPQRFANLALRPFMERGGIVLACGAALANWSAAIAAKDGVSRQEAYARARAGLLPGIYEQPSGVFAAVKAQEEGCVYVRAS